MPESLETRVTAALARIQNPRLDNDLLSAGMIRDLSVQPDGGVSFTFLLSPEDPATLVRQARAAVQSVEGVRKDGVRISVTNPAGPARVTHGPPGSAPIPPSAAPPADQPELGRVIAISSGKGGVGKSTVAANLAIALAEAGHRVGVMDADVYGPNIPRMFGLFERPPVLGGKIQPLEAYGVRLMSLGFLVERDAPAIWRGPIIVKIVQQFLRDVDWGRLDYLIVDLPPGTGDVSMSIAQFLPQARFLIVTTPQPTAQKVARRAARMAEKVEHDIAGVVENMSGFTTPGGEHFDIFGSDGGATLAEELGVPLLGRIPLTIPLREQADRGRPLVAETPSDPAAAAISDVARKLIELTPLPLPLAPRPAAVTGTALPMA